MMLQLRQPASVILNVSSIGSMLSKYILPYSVAKAGVSALSDGLHNEYCDQGLIVHALLTARVMTPGLRRSSSMLLMAPPARL